MNCAKCGADVENGGIDKCSIVSDLDPDQPGTMRTLRFCRDRLDGGRKVKGCTRKVFSKANLKFLEESRGSTSE